MKKSICLYFQVNQPTGLRLYRFFDIGKDSHYYDDYANRTAVRKAAQSCYLPMNALLLDAIRKTKGKFKLAFSIPGSTLELLDRYAPEVIDGFRDLAATGSVEFLCETYYNSLSSVGPEGEFKLQVLKHKAAINNFFGVEPKAFRNTELIYSDSIGAQLYGMGFKTVLAEGARHIMGWKSPNYVYSNDLKDGQKILLRNYSLSDDISFRFADREWSEWPLTADKYVNWLDSAEGDVLNIFMDYESFGAHQGPETGIFEFMEALPGEVLKRGTMEFATPSEAAKKHASVGEISVPQPTSWSDEERDLSSWLGNELQQDAFNKLYGLQEKLSILDDASLWAEYGHLQESQNFYYMSTKFFSTGRVERKDNPYGTPYEAFINYMNVLSDFIIRVNNAIAEK